MADTETPKIYLFFTDYIRAEIKPISINSDDETQLSSNFDYEMLFDGTKRVYIDIGLNFNRVEIMFRSGFEFDGRELEWSDVFTPEYILPFTAEAIDLCYEAYTEYCSEHGISLSEDIEYDPTLAEEFSQSIIERYLNYRSSDDAKNAYLLSNVGLECESGTDSILVFKCTYTILREILFSNTAFSNSRNRDAFGEVIPLPRYITIKNNCMLIEVEDVLLNFVDTVYFLQCLDCALQMLVGDKSDIVASAIASKGISNEMVQAYIKAGTKQFKQFREMLQSSNASIANLETLHDWNSLLH